MKYILIVLLATMAMPTFSQEKDKEVMIKKIFRTLQQKDESGFIKLFPDAAIMKEFVLKEIGEDTLNEEYKTMLADITNSSLQKEFGEMFKEIIEKGEGKGVEWAKTNFVSFTADTSVEETQSNNTAVQTHHRWRCDERRALCVQSHQIASRERRFRSRHRRSERAKLVSGRRRRAAKERRRRRGRGR